MKLSLDELPILDDSLAPVYLFVVLSLEFVLSSKVGKVTKVVPNRIPALVQIVI